MPKVFKLEHIKVVTIHGAVNDLDFDLIFGGQTLCDHLVY